MKLDGSQWAQETRGWTGTSPFPGDTRNQNPHQVLDPLPSPLWLSVFLWNEPSPVKTHSSYPNSTRTSCTKARSCTRPSLYSPQPFVTLQHLTSHPFSSAEIKINPISLKEWTVLRGNSSWFHFCFANVRACISTLHNKQSSFLVPPNSADRDGY